MEGELYFINIIIPLFTYNYIYIPVAAFVSEKLVFGTHY